MKYKSLIFSTLFLAVVTSTAILFNSCEKSEAELPKNNAISNTEISLKDDALSFQTADAFFETSGKLGEMTEKERQDWEASISFVSMRTELISIFQQVEAAENEAAIEQIVSSNSDLVKLVDGEVYPIIESNSYAAITNRKGIFFVEGVIHKVEGGKIASSEDGNEQTVTNALHGNLKSSNPDVNVIEYISNSTLKSGGCGTRMSAYKEHDGRKCDFEMKTYKYYCTGCCGIYYYQVKAESKITNYKKSWGKWRTYNTACTMKDRGYTISVPKVTGYNGQHSTFYYHDVTHTFGTDNSSYDCATMTRWSYVGDRVQNIGINTPSFNRVKGKATNRGIGDRWAVINCGSW